MIEKVIGWVEMTIFFAEGRKGRRTFDITQEFAARHLGLAAAEFARWCYAYKQEEERGGCFGFESAMNAVTYRNIELLQIEETESPARAFIRERITEDEQWRLWHELSAIIGTTHGGVMPYFRAVQILGHDAVNRALAIPPCKWILYGIGNGKKSLKFISCRAFIDAVAFHNMEIEQKQRRRKRKAAIDAGTSTAGEGKETLLSKSSITHVEDKVNTAESTFPVRPKRSQRAKK